METDTAPSLLLRPVVLRSGSVDEEIAQRIRRGEWSRLQRGAYLPGRPDLDVRERHVLAVRATVAGLRTPAVVSHVSAAALHGLPLWGVPLARVHVTREPPARTAVESRLHSHAARLGPDDVVLLGGTVTTCAARTVVDVARSVPFAAALSLADAALHRGLTTGAELDRCLAAAEGAPGCRSARRVVAAADGRSESVGESRSRALFIQWGLPVPTLQRAVHRPDGAFVGRADFAWEERRLLGEFDGLVKYGRLLRPGQSAGDAVVEEKLREDALREEDWGVVRWVWRDLDSPTSLLARITRRLDRAA